MDELPETLAHLRFLKADVRVGKPLTSGIYGDSSIGELSGEKTCVVIKYLCDFDKLDDRITFLEKMASLAFIDSALIAEFCGFIIRRRSLCIITPLSHGNLRDLLDRRQKLRRWPIGFGKVQMAVLYCCVSIVLKELHDRGILHGNLKPSNILLTRDFTPVLADISQSIYIRGRKIEQPMDLLYVAPEMMESRDKTKEADVYSFGMLLFVLKCPDFPLILADGTELTPEYDIAELRKLISKGLVFKRPDDIEDNYWDLVCSCLDKNPRNRPQFSEIISRTKCLPNFKTPSRNMSKYLERLTELTSCFGQYVGGPSVVHEDVLLFEHPVYKDAIANLSREIVAAGSAVTEKKRTFSEVHFDCRYCTASYRLVLDHHTQTWKAYQTGTHTGHDGAKGKPIKQHLDDCITAGLAMGRSGTRLMEFVADETGVKVPTSTVMSRSKKRPDFLWKRQWKMLPSLGERFASAGLRYQLFMGEHDNTIEAVAFELQGVKFCSTSAFIGLLFVDGTFLHDRVRSILLLIATITADHVVIPVIGMICSGENLLSYERLFRFARESLPKQFTIMSDGAPSIRTAFNKVFLDMPEVKRLPCMFHVTQRYPHQLRFDIKQVLTCDHPDVYKEMIKIFSSIHKNTYAKINKKMEKLCYMSNSFAGIFEVMADSPIESLNAALLPYRGKGPTELVQILFRVCADQIEKQEEKLRNVGKFCVSCSNTIQHRERQTSAMVCRKEKTGYIVSESFSIGLSVDYKLEIRETGLVCQCLGYERLGIPCRHMYAFRKTFRAHHHLIPKVTAIHRVETIRSALQETKINLGTQKLEEADVIPPSPTARPGRPKMRRYKPIREHVAKTSNVKCGACGERGHTRRSVNCPARRKGRKEGPRRETLRDQAIRASQTQRSRSCESRPAPMCLDVPEDEREEEDEERYHAVSRQIESDKAKASSALVAGAMDLMSTFT